jgi:hypothetical protein
MDKFLQPYKEKDGTEIFELVEAHTRNNMLGIRPEKEEEKLMNMEISHR